MKHAYHIMGTPQRKIEVEQLSNGEATAGDFRLTLDGVEQRCSATWAPNRVKLVIENKVRDCFVERTEGGYTIYIDGQRIPVDLLSDSQLRRRNATGTDTSDGSPLVTSPMIGKVVEVHVAVGDTVEVGDALLIIEAMKMENEILARRSGTIEAIRVSAGDKVEAGKPLLRFADGDD